MNVVSFRLPNADSPLIYEVGRPIVYKDNPSTDGFIISPFEKEGDILFYPFKKQLAHIPDDTSINLSSTSSSASLESPWNYQEYVAEAIRKIKSGVFTKVVTSSRKIMKISVSAYSLFEKLVGKYPDAFVFLISTEEFGTWVGASPELLLQHESGKITSMSLAGTRPVDEDKTQWDFKNRIEQELVTRHIVEVLENAGLKCKVDAPETVRAGKLEHIRSRIECDASDALDYALLLKRLSPTPALGGFPQLPALDFIKRKEGKRELYGGFAGPMDKSGNFDLFVLIRCAKLLGAEALLFAGGGITELSDPVEEDEEIRNKFGTIESIFFEKSLLS